MIVCARDTLWQHERGRKGSARGGVCAHMYMRMHMRRRTHARTHACTRTRSLPTSLALCLPAQMPSWASQVRGAFTEYPFTGTSAMLALTPENNYMPEVVYFGGQYSYAWINTTAVRQSMRIKVEWDPATGNYSFGGCVSSGCASGPR